jgi:Dolichyl-phosphate-mannose-protein mannosyltransferase
MSRKQSKTLLTAESRSENTVLAFLGRHSLLLALLFLGISCARIAGTYSVFSSTNDEPDHLACGIEYLVNHTFKLETQHPPLTRLMIALLPYLDGARPQGFNNHHEEGWAMLTYQHHPERTLTLARLGNLPFFLLGGIVIFLWARRYFTSEIAVLATFLYSLIPPVLAHAGLATTDMGLAACLGTAFLTLVIWAEEPTYPHALLAGVACAAASLAKFTALGYLPAAAVLALICYFAIECPGAVRFLEIVKARVPSFALAVATGLFLWWAAYFFTWGKVPHGTSVLPAPDYWDGILDALKHNREGHGTYLFGQHSMLGWWYFFPVAIGVKTPLAFLLLMAGGLVTCWQRRLRLAYLLPVAFSLGVLLPAMAGHVNIGVRHVLPIYLGLSIVAAVFLAELIEWAPSRKWAGPLALVLTLWCVATGVIHHPDYIPYFNELVADGRPVTLDSDYDWGQDNKRLAARLRQLGATSVNLGRMGKYDQEFLQTFPGLPHINPINPIEPAAGWTAVSPTLALTVQYGLDYRYPGVRQWFEFLEPKERVGTLTLYYLPPGFTMSR